MFTEEYFEQKSLYLVLSGQILLLETSKGALERRGSNDGAT